MSYACLRMMQNSKLSGKWMEKLKRTGHPRLSRLFNMIASGRTMTYFYMPTIIIQPWKRSICVWYRMRAAHTVGAHIYLHARSQRLLIDIDVYRHFRGTRSTDNNYYTCTRTVQRPSISIPDRVPWKGQKVKFKGY